MFEISPIITCNAFSGAFYPITTDILCETYLLPVSASFYLEAKLATGIWPWSKSHECAPAETTAAVAHAFRQFVEATPTLRPKDVNLSRLASESRGHIHAAALLELWKALEGALPLDLAVWRGVLEASADAPIAKLPIVTDPPPPGASPAYRAVYGKLVADHGRAPASAQAQWANRQAPLTKGADANTSLHHVQHNLLTPEVERRPLDSSLRFISLRDYADETDCAAALVQAGLKRDKTAKEQDFGLLIPDDPVFCAHLQRAFTARGIALSALPSVRTSVDVAGETLLNFLIALRRPAPAMALASLYISPLMPWNADIGHEMADEVMGGWFNYRGAVDFPDATAEFYRFLRQSDVTENRALGLLLNVLGKVVQREGACAAAARQIDARIGQFRALLAAAPETPPDWEMLIRLATPKSAQNPAQTKFADGVPVFSAAAVPWRPVKHLLVMGYAAGSYPSPVGGNPFFLDSELLDLREKAALHIPTRAEILEARFARFQQQLCVATKSVTFLCPERDGAGMALGPPTSLALIARTIAGADNYETLPTPLELSLGDAPFFTMRQIKPWPFDIQYQLPYDQKIQLDRDLLRLRKTDNGIMLRQTPSRLETLLVSPLVWVLNELGAQPSIWAPEEFDIMLRGSLAHDVLENLFLPGQDLPAPDIIPDAAHRLCDQAIKRLAPFLQSNLWKVERLRFVGEVIKAALVWRKNLLELEAEVLVNEVRLSGEANGILVSGRADCILRLRSGQLLIVDHKKSSSGKRRERMLEGWDLQLALYRDMLLRPDFKDRMVRDLLSEHTDIAVAYHTMNDGAVLCHGLYGASAGAIEVIADNVSVKAIDMLKTRLAEVGAGMVRLNTDEDEDFFNKTAKITPYALTSSYLAGAFTVPPRPNWTLE